MNSPFLDLPVRTENEARLDKFQADNDRVLAEFKAKQDRALRDFRREQFIGRQLAGMRDAGFSEAEITREEALLRGGAEVVELINHICAGAGGLK